VLQARFAHTVTTLLDGRVLAVGGMVKRDDHSQLGRETNTCELYDPATRSWQRCNAMTVARASFSYATTLLPDGHVFVAGGKRAPELWNPATGTWTRLRDRIPGLLMQGQACVDTCVALVGGAYTQRDRKGDFDEPIQGIELWDATTGQYRHGDLLTTARSRPSVTPLPRGLLLVAGGDGARASATSEVRSPLGGDGTGAIPLAVPRLLHGAVRLHDGRVMVAGGVKGPHAPGPSEIHETETVELFDPDDLTWKPAAPLACRRSAMDMLVLPDGRVIVLLGYAYGFDRGALVPAVEIWDPRTEHWSPGPEPSQYRHNAACALLHDGTVLVTGGRTYEGEPIANDELLTP
jgi:hypothetical protein